MRNGKKAIFASLILIFLKTQKNLQVLNKFLAKLKNFPTFSNNVNSF